MRDVVETIERTIESSGLTETNTFSIATNGKAFTILLAGLYSDKPRAIIRELCSNAFDSHVMAGIIDRPFKVHVPTVWEQEFSVRDYGVSLTHEQVMTLYTTVFMSTKEDSNNQVGKFGLGSKTPFAYADSYTVTAILDGKKRSYNAYLDEKSIPMISLIHQEDTDEEQGVEVSFPVHANDVRAFAFAAQRVMLGFDITPDINITIEKPEVSIKGDNWTLYRENKLVERLHVRQGCVLYPVDRYALQAIDPDGIDQGLFRQSIVLEMPVGSVDITPDREKLSYDATTRKNISEALKGVSEEMVKVAIEKISLSETLHDAAVALNQQCADINLNESLARKIHRNARWQGRRVPHSFSIRNPRMLKRNGLNLNLYMYSRGRYSRLAIDSTLQTWKNSYKGYSPHTANFVPHPINIYYYSGVEPPKKFHLMEKYIKETLSSNSPITLFAANLDLKCRGLKMLSVMLGRRKDINLIDMETLDLSSVTPVRKVRDAGEKVLLRFLHYGCNTLMTIGGYMAMRSLPKPETTNVFYIMCANEHPIFDGKKLETATLIRFVNEATAWRLFPECPTVIGIPKSRKDIIKTFPKHWRDLEEEIMDLIGEFDGEEVRKYLDIKKNHLEFDDEYTLNRVYKWLKDGHKVNASFFVKAKKEHDEALKLVEYGKVMDNVILPILSWVNQSWINDGIKRECNKIAQTNDSNKTVSLARSLYDRYPMLEAISVDRHSYSKTNEKEFVNIVATYIKQMDQLAKIKTTKTATEVVQSAD
jgi:hypothetical protein